MAVRWLTPFRWLHDRLHAIDAAEDRKYWEDRGTVDFDRAMLTSKTYPHVTVPPVKSYVSPSVHYLGRNRGVPR